ncbi:Zinc finger, FYVE/PHD-type,PDZ domain,Zinc finger, RING-type,Zinc finger, RING/FYVE/PHD-type,C2 [Cinara cedri]|uniref:Zinc finger, FYVE/PHD-type,PDZ domain,Zinc finger, RING-type,Zinc finger, RING/FYVE/PHD-type,C2 n=1 Tax=Cinara cedri TaxID=506608 RepID=A0A5E4MWH5_9HEMI|nr:Zinc finger, FYVE/PHD-type,PDZ domain,Zinc finger, RING-type,Zinc finger, RING/FYVE/PHD-type,C2 [Cinara cedri]
MIPTNVMSFINKIVPPVPAESSSGSEATVQEQGTRFSKIRQTLSSSLMTAQDKMTTKLNSNRQSPAESSPNPSPASPPEDNANKQPTTTAKPELTKQSVCRSGGCRVCLKSFKEGDYSRVCFGCKFKVCEDCATSYTKIDENQDENTWCCSICRRKQQSSSILQPVMTQNSTDSLLDVPIADTLQRRHSDVKIGRTSGSATSGNGSLGSGLAPPRSPELRRHSDVSPATLKDMEKAAAALKVSGDRSRITDDKLWNRDTGFRQDRQKRGSAGAVIGQSTNPTQPSVFRFDTRRESKISMPSTDDTADDPGDAESRWRRGARGAVQRVRRKSRVQKQHSYDDDVKPGVGPTGGQGAGVPSTLTTEGQAQLPRRASAYDVYQNQGSSPASRRSSFRPQQDEDGGGVSLQQKDQSQSLGMNNDDDWRPRRRGSQLPDISNLRSSAESRSGRNSFSNRSGADIQQQTQQTTTAIQETEQNDTMRRQPSVAGEDIKIVIHDVDFDPNLMGVRSGSKRKVILKRDLTDKAHRTRGFGMRVVGGKIGPDGQMFASIVWTVPGGPAEKSGLQQGDKVLEWAGVSLANRSFEEVCSIIDRSGDVVELLVEQGYELRICDLLDEPGPMTSRKNSGEAMGLQLDGSDSPASPTRRKLPKTPTAGMSTQSTIPEDSVRERNIIGGIQMQVWYRDGKNELSISVLAANGLQMRNDADYGLLPEAYLQIKLLPFTVETNIVKTEIAEPSLNPIWNTTLEMPNVRSETLIEKQMEVVLYDYRPDKEDVILGEFVVNLQNALLDNAMIWYELESPNHSKASKSPRSSISDVGKGGLRSQIRSASEERELDGFLHPDHAYIANSRRGSSQSEQLDVEPYQLNKDFSRSLPGSRRSSFQSAQNTPEKDPELPTPQYTNKSRRRSSCTPRQDPDEILKNLKAVKGELLGRSKSICGDKRGMRRGSVSIRPWKESAVAEKPEPSTSKQEEEPTTESIQLGPGQIMPRGYNISSGSHIELKLGLLMTKGQLEVDVVCARGIRAEDSPPDTYVKTYLRENDRWLQKRKTRVVRHNCNPEYNQILRYSACDVLGRSLLVMLWERQKGFEHNQGLGGAEVTLDALKLTRVTEGWYPLFPIQSLGSDSNDSP